MFTDQKCPHGHTDYNCGRATPCKDCTFHRNNVDPQPTTQKRYFGSYPFDMDELISQMIDSPKKVASSKAKV